MTIRDPPRATLSSAEERFERARHTVGLFLGPVMFAVLWWLEMPSLSPEAHRLAAIVSLVVVWWVTEAVPLPVTGLVGTTLSVLCGVATAPEAFAPYASPIIFLFIGSFIIAEAAATHGLDRRLALGILSLPAVRGQAWRVRLAMGGLTVGLSAWMSNTATAAMMVPVAVGVITASGGDRPRDRGAIGLLLTIAYGAAIGGTLTPVGSPPNLIGLGLLDDLAGVRIDFLTWMALALPLGLALSAALFGLSSLLFGRPEEGAAMPETVDLLGPTDWTPGQRNCLVAFGLAVALWITPGVVAVGGWSQTSIGQTLTRRLDEGAVAVAAAALLFLLPIDWPQRRFTVTWQDAARIDWGTILLFGAGLSMGRLMFETGLAERLGAGLIAASGAETLWGITALAIALGIVVTEITSNTAATNMLVPVILTIASAAQIHPVPPVLGACLGASMAFMLPVSTPPNAIVYGTGRVPITTMISFGVLLDLVAFVVLLVGLWLLCPLFGYV